ncbi:ComEC/Rec2 family competence protein [Marinoscillum furvescens]|uniref:Competence protein ComEC n=1 Tax=Marinoscillum furvescens DSM 4134 TaxID=1122208 RepID=A0A3D9L0R7_MARFU|nr:ComEC/Rec2 family competence protein [Marinoscillum furvescens]RED97043.1 competence protein ComEC [Marinoscillum furvescens DSM 4134]
MYKWTAFPFVRIAMCLIAGVLLADYFVPTDWSSVSWHYHLAFVTLGALVYYILPANWRGSWCMLLLVVLGTQLNYWSDHRHGHNHYTHFDRVEAFTGRVTSDLVERKDYYRYEVEVSHLRVDSGVYETTGEVYLYVKKSNAPTYTYGDVLVVRKGFFEVATPKNPYEFDYRQYLSLQNIYAHAFVSSEDVKVLGHAPPNSLLAMALHIRVKARELLFECIRSTREQAIVVALLLGVKDYLDSELKEAYSSAGAMHVLAVSGLHVGIVYLLLSLAFKRFKNTLVGAVAFVLLSLTIIWLYALVTGFSPSVMRAATMFSVVILSDGLQRRSNIFNSLGVAAVLLILINPKIIYAVGFQLSFAAVLGIVLLHGPLYRLLDIQGKVLDYVWSITCVSVAAQLATFPLTLLYFHQFPTYFLISNLVVIPAATVMMVGGLVVVVSAAIYLPLGAFLGGLYEYFVWVINEVVMSIGYLPFPLFDWLYMESWEVWVVYFSLICLIIGFRSYRYKYLVLAAMGFMVWNTHVIFREIDRVNQRKLVFYELEEGIAIDLISGTEALLLLDREAMAHFSELPPQINPNRLALGLPKMQENVQLIEDSEFVERHAFFDLIEWHGKRVALIKQDLSDFAQKHPVHADVVFFPDHTVWLDSLETTGLQLLGAGHRYYQVRKAKAHKTNVHSLTYDGSYELIFGPEELNESRKFLSFF